VTASLLEQLADLPKAEVDALIRAMAPGEANAFEYDWRYRARPEQLPPDGSWRIWLLMAGRGFGKTRSGAEWVRAEVKAGRRRIALVGPTAADARNVMVEGASGILAISPDPERPLYEPSKRRLTWPNGAVATTYSADEPERLRRGMASSSNIVWGALDLGLRCSAVAVASIRRAARSRQLLCADDAQALLRKGANEGSGRVAGHFSGPAGTPASLRR